MQGATTRTLPSQRSMQTQQGDHPQRESVLDVTEEKIARTYATAILDAAAQAGVEREVVDDLCAVADEVLGAHPQFAEALRSAFVSHEERTAMLARVLGGRVNPLTLNAINVVSAHNRGGILRSIARQAERLHEVRTDRVRVTVTSADPLPQDLVDEVAGVARRMLGAEPIVSLRVDPELIGGLEVRIGDTVYDGSLRTAFSRSRQAMISKTIEMIEKNPESFLTAG